ncbi:hypothetical protein JOE11_001606 [Robbsia andropogonis]
MRESFDSGSVVLPVLDGDATRWGWTQQTISTRCGARDYLADHRVAHRDVEVADDTQFMPYLAHDGVVWWDAGHGNGVLLMQAFEARHQFLAVPMTRHGVSKQPGGINKFVQLAVFAPQASQVGTGILAFERCAG